jgi:hypothetical protein
MAITIDINSMLDNVDVSTVRDRTKKAKVTTVKKKRATDSDKVDVMEEAINKVSEFKSPRHLVEYTLVKDSTIRFDQIERLVKREFPGKTFDAADFMMVKLDYARNKKLNFGEEILEQIKKEQEIK